MNRRLDVWLQSFRFGGHTVAAAGDNITWATTISSVTYSDKTAVHATGFDTNTPINGASYGSVGDSTQME